MNESTSLNIVFGGVEISVAHLDETTETVKVRQLPIKDMPRYMACFEDEEKTVELFCAQSPGWASALSRESFEEILTKGEELNLDFLERHAARSQKRREKIMPGMAEKIMQAALSRLPNGSASSPSNVG